MKISLPQELKAILVGTVLGGVSSVLLSLTLEPEISESRMGQYGGFIGLISSAVSTAVMAVSNQKNSNKNIEATPNNSSQQLNLQDILINVVSEGVQKHLDSLQPGSPDYFKTLETYGKVLIHENTPPPTNTQKSKIPHHKQGGD